MQSATTLNYHLFIQLAKEAIRKQHFSKADYYLYLSLLSPNIDIMTYITLISLRSHIYSELKDCKMLLYLSTKLLKLFPLIIEQVNNVQAINDVVLILFRTGIALYCSGEYNMMLPYYFLSVSKRLIKQKQVSIDSSIKEYFNTHYDKIKSALRNELSNIKQSYYDILTLNGEEFRIEEKDTLYSVIDELIEESNYDKVMQGDEKEYYVISNKWLRRYKAFLLKLNSFRESPFKFNEYLNKGFDTTLQYFNFIEEDIEKYNCPYINSINNFWIEQFKDSWAVSNQSTEKGEEETDAYLKSFISKEEFSLVTKTQWEGLAKNFGYVNKIKRCKAINGGIEVHLKRIKVMVLDPIQSNANNWNAIRPKSIQLSKEKTVNDLLLRIGLRLEDSFKQAKGHCYKMDLHSMSLIERKQLIFEIMMSYHHSIDSINLKCEIVHQESALESLEDRSLIIIEQAVSSKPFHFIKSINNENPKCSYAPCHSTQELTKCSKCRVNIINSYWYCSRECEMRDIAHCSYHNYLSKYLIVKTSLSDLKEISFMSLLSNDSNAKRGQVAFSNHSNASLTNCIISVLANCEELTKYILTERYLNELNDSSKSKVLKEYSSLLKMIWRGTEPVVNVNDFINSPDKFEYDKDSHSLLILIIVILHKHLNRAISHPNLRGLNRPISNKTEAEMSMLHWQQFKEKEDSLVIDLFYGQFQHKAQCSKCSNTSLSYQPFNSLSITIIYPPETLKFLFFPVIHQSNDNQSNLVYHQYAIRIDKTIRVSDLQKAVIANNSYLTIDSLEVDVMLLKPNKQFDHMITISKDNDDISYAYDDIKKGYQLVLYEKTRGLRNVYVYPCDFITKYQLFFIPYIDVTYLSYPASIQMKATDKVNDLYVLVKKAFRSLFVSSDSKKCTYKQFLFDNSKMIEQENELFRLFIYNTKQEEGNDEGSIWNFKIKSMSNSNLCSFCGQHCSYCPFSGRFNQNESLEYIFSHLNEDCPFVLYAQLLSFNKTASLFTSNNQDRLSYGIENKYALSLNDCLISYFNEKNINEDNGLQCSKCSRTSQTSINKAISIPPFYLVIHLSSKYKVDYPLQGLSITPHIAHHQSEVLYDLNKVILQNSFNRYYSICEYFDKWLYLSGDQAFVKENFFQNEADNATLLIYKRRESS